MRLRDPRGGGVLSSTFKYWSLAPAVLVLAALTVLPALALLRMSVSTITFANGRELWAFTPARNFAALTSDPGLTATIVNTLLFVVVAVAIEMAAGLALALLVGGLTRGKGLMRTILIVPILVPPVAIGNMFKLMYNYDFGLFNQVAGRARRARRELARVDIACAVVDRAGRRLALGAVRLPDPVRRGRGAAGRRARSGACRRCQSLADAGPDQAAPAEAGDRRRAAVPFDPRFQGVRRGVPAHGRRSWHVERAREPAPVSACSSSRTSSATARCCRC